jgi:hypothetical protein
VWENRGGTAAGGVARESAGAEPSAVSASGPFAISGLAVGFAARWSALALVFGPGRGPDAVLPILLVNIITYNLIVKWNITVGQARAGHV